MVYPSIWITFVTITIQNLQQIMKVAGTRWHIESHNFNPLKNQGYNFKHNYEYGNKNLTTFLSLLITFIIDQAKIHN